MTAVALSARCAELGLPLDRNVIAKLENGHRNSVTVDEVLVLAAALRVPPSHLLFGVGGAEAEVLPGKRVPAWRAAEWLSDRDGDLDAEYDHERQLPMMAVLPGGGWHVQTTDSDGTRWSEPLIGWGLLADGHTIVPLATDCDGFVLRMGREWIKGDWRLVHPERRYEPAA